jgi:hypothetical protein
MTAAEVREACYAAVVENKRWRYTRVVDCTVVRDAMSRYHRTVRCLHSDDVRLKILLKDWSDWRRGYDGLGMEIRRLAEHCIVYSTPDAPSVSRRESWRYSGAESGKRGKLLHCRDTQKDFFLHEPHVALCYHIHKLEAGQDKEHMPRCICRANLSADRPIGTIKNAQSRVLPASPDQVGTGNIMTTAV